MSGVLKLLKARRAAKRVAKEYQGSAVVAERARRARDLGAAASEVKAAKKFAGKQGFKRGVGVGVAGVIAEEFLRKNKVSVSTEPRKKKKVVKKPKPYKSKVKLNFK